VILVNLPNITQFWVKILRSRFWRAVDRVETFAFARFRLPGFARPGGSIGAGIGALPPFFVYWKLVFKFEQGMDMHPFPVILSKKKQTARYRSGAKVERAA